MTAPSTDLRADTPRADSWAEPIPFDHPINLPPFPVEALPEPLQSMVREVSASVDISEMVPGLLSLTVAAILGAGRFLVQVDVTHAETMALWVVVTLGSGERKTAAFNAMTAPFHGWEQA